MQPDCVIIDVKMPGLDGYQLVRALRGDPDSAATPLILLTALAQEQQQFAGLALGTDQYLIKPVTPREVVSAVARALVIREEDQRTRMHALLSEREERETSEGMVDTPPMQDTPGDSANETGAGPSSILLLLRPEAGA